MGYFTCRKKAEHGPNADALIRQAEASLEQTKKQQPHVDRINGWLKDRENRNGFGDDFEYTLKPKRRHA
jgi:hypothetical protein